MPQLSRRNSIPIIYATGTHYEVGFDVGRTFRGLIEDFLLSSTFLRQTLLPAYNTEKGKAAYEACLANLNENYPQYVRELKGTSDGAKVPFHHLMLLHLDQVIPKAAGMDPANICGCSSICCNTDSEVILGHTEDGHPDKLNNVYIVSAHIKEPCEQGRWKTNNERYTVYCYAGYLPGSCMGYNHHGLILSHNVIAPKINVPGKTSRFFIARSLLAAKTMSEAHEILRDRGVGSSDAASFNMISVSEEGSLVFHNAEIGPAEESANESPLSVHTISPGEYLMHTNTFLRHKIPEDDIEIASSRHRLERGSAMAKPLSRKAVLEILSDYQDAKYPIFRNGKEPDHLATISVGLFDIFERTWTIWMKNPKTCEPVASLPLIFKWNNK